MTQPVQYLLTYSIIIHGIVNSAEMIMCVGHFDSGFESNSEMVNAERRMSNHADQCNSVWRINCGF